MKLITALRTSIAQEIRAAIANGSTRNPKLEIYDGNEPAQMGQTITDTLLSEHDLTTTVGTISNGVITFGVITDDPSANNSGTAGWARILDRTGAEVLYLSVTQSGGGGNIQLNTVNISTGLPVSITSGTFTVGGQ